MAIWKRWKLTPLCVTIMRLRLVSDDCRWPNRPKVIKPSRNSRIDAMKPPWTSQKRSLVLECESHLDRSTNLIDYCRMIPLPLVIPFVLAVSGLILCFADRYAMGLNVASKINPRSRITLFAGQNTPVCAACSMFKSDKWPTTCRMALGLIADGPNEAARILGLSTEALGRIHWKLSSL